MRIPTFLHCALVVAFLAISGCENQSSQTTSASSPPTASLNDDYAAINRVFENHAVEADELTLTTAEVEQRLGTAQEWTEFSIDEIGSGQYEGQATSPIGELLNVEVRQTANGIYSRWTSADGVGWASIVW